MPYLREDDGDDGGQEEAEAEECVEAVQNLHTHFVLLEDGNLEIKSANGVRCERSRVAEMKTTHQYNERGGKRPERVNSVRKDRESLPESDGTSARVAEQREVRIEEGGKKGDGQRLLALQKTKDQRRPKRRVAPEEEKTKGKEREGGKRTRERGGGGVPTERVTERRLMWPNNTKQSLCDRNCRRVVDSFHFESGNQLSEVQRPGCVGWRARQKKKDDTKDSRGYSGLLFLVLP